MREVLWSRRGDGGDASDDFGDNDDSDGDATGAGVNCVAGNKPFSTENDFIDIADMR